MGGIEAVVMKSARPVTVVRRAALTRGTDGRPTEGAATTATVRLAIQPGSACTLTRNLDGDTSGGTVTIWASLTDLAAAYESDDLSHTALGWTELNIAPAKGESGPRGDYVTWRGRQYEIGVDNNFEDGGLIPTANIQRYIGTDQGAA
jgi:hypothetical protein